MWAIVQVALLAYAGWRRRCALRRKWTADKRKFQQDVELAARAARADRQGYLGWEGERLLRVDAIVDETPDVKSFYLTDVDGHPLPRFEPGQYLTIHFATAPDEKPLVRCYSLSDRPHEEYYRLTVKRCDSPVDRPELPHGRGSHRLHRYTHVGETLRVSAPRGGFFLDPRGNRPLVFVAGGIGVTPLLAMLAELVDRGEEREVYFFYGVRNSANHPLRDHLAELASKREHVHLFTSYSQPLATDALHTDYQRAGRLSADYLRQVLPPGRFDYYLCGPGGMMQSIVLGLLEQGVPEEAIHYEAFGPASIPRRQAPGSPTATTPCEVELATSHHEAQWSEAYASLLELLEEVGAAVDSGCRSGNCGLCATRVLDGSFDTIKPPGANVPDGHCLACISVPTSKLVLDL